jgi:hypothetical protein
VHAAQLVPVRLRAGGRVGRCFHGRQEMHPLAACQVIEAVPGVMYRTSVSHGLVLTQYNISCTVFPSL